MKTAKTTRLLPLLFAISSTPTLAQTLEEPGLTAQIKAAVSHDDNIFKVTEEFAKSDDLVRVSPNLKMIGALGKHRFKLSYLGDYAKFKENKDADYYDHDLSARIDLIHSLRFSSRFEARYQDEHEDPSAINRLQLNINEYNKYEQSFALAGMSYGTEESIGRVDLNYRFADKNYINNELDFLDHKNNELTLTFSYRIAPQTKVYIETEYNDLDYNNTGVIELDNKYKRYSAGISWKYSEVITGNLNAGYQERDYSDETIRNVDGLAYDAQVIWNATSYTSAIINSRKESIDSTIENSGGFVRTSYSLDLKHELTPLLKLNGKFELAEDELAIISNRVDKTKSFEFGIEYFLRRNINIGASYEVVRRDSTLVIAEFDANILSLNINITAEN